MLIFYLISLLFFDNLIAKPIITNGLGGGLGDNLAIFCLGRSLALKYDLDFELQTFDGSEFFTFHDNLKIIHGPLIAKPLDSETDLLNALESNQKFYAHIFTDCGFVSKDILDVLRRELTIKEALPEWISHLPSDKIKVAVHIRTGLGKDHYDGELCSIQLYDYDATKIQYHKWDALPFIHLVNLGINPFFPKKVCSDITFNSLRFPPLQFYLDQLARLYEYFGKEPLFVHIFTDHPEPQKLLLEFKKFFLNRNIEFYCNEYAGNKSLISEIYAMSKFNVLVRSYSYFARISELIGDHKLIIFPLKYIWEDGKLIITDVAIKKTEG